MFRMGIYREGFWSFSKSSTHHAEAPFRLYLNKMYQKQHAEIGKYYQCDFNYTCNADGVFSGATALTEFEDFFANTRYCMFIRDARLTRKDIVFDVLTLDSFGRACLLTKKYPLAASFCEKHDIEMSETSILGISDIAFCWTPDATVEAIEVELARDLGNAFVIRLGVVDGITPTVVWNDWFKSKRVKKEVVTITIDAEPDLIVID